MSDRTVEIRDLYTDIEATGYYPALVSDSLRTSIAGEQIRAHALHHEATFDREQVRRHITVLVLTDRRLVIAHVDEHVDDAASESVSEHAGEGDTGHSSAAFATSEAVRLDKVESVAIARLVEDPANYKPGSLPSEVVLTIGWGAVNRVDVEPATCGDPECQAEHGFTGSMSNDDFTLRVSVAADGVERVEQFLTFAQALSDASAYRGS